MHQFDKLHERIPEGQRSNVKIQHFEMTKTDSIYTMMSHYAGLMYCPPGKYVRLLIGDTIVMSNSRMEQNSNWEVVNVAHGNVLLAGLGLGMIVIPIVEKANVKSVTVIEANQDVIDLVLPHVQHEKLSVVCADIFDWRPVKGTLYDSIYFDIWSEISEDNLQQMRKLHYRFKYYLNRTNQNRYMESWQRDYLRTERARDRRANAPYERVMAALGGYTEQLKGQMVDIKL